MSNVLQFYNDPQKITGLDEQKLNHDALLFRENLAPSHTSNWMDMLIHQTIFKDGEYYYFDPAHGTETWREWHIFIRLLHKCITVRNTLHCLAADERDNFRERFDLPITLGGSEEPIFGDEILKENYSNEE